LSYAALDNVTLLVTLWVEGGRPSCPASAPGALRLLVG
jgi:hypothetical protein